MGVANVNVANMARSSRALIQALTLSAGNRTAMKMRDMVTGRPEKVLLTVDTQNLYGEKTFEVCERNIGEIIGHLGRKLPVRIEYGGLIKSPEEAQKAVERVNRRDSGYIALVSFAHTFSPNLMHGLALQDLNLPLINVCTQFFTNPPTNLCMEIMNHYQTAHGAVEFANSPYPMSNIAGHWQDPDFVNGLNMYLRAAAGIKAMRDTRIAVIGQNKMNWVGGTAIGEATLQHQVGATALNFEDDVLQDYMKAVKKADIDAIYRVLNRKYNIEKSMKPGGKKSEALRYALRVTLAINALLKDNKCTAFTTHFDGLNKLKQLPGLAAQLLMAFGIAFGPEGDRMASLSHAICQAMGQGMVGVHGLSSLTEPYMYDFVKKALLIAHMLEFNAQFGELDPEKTADLVIRFLGIGPSEDPPRILFDLPGGLENTSLFSLYNPGGTGFRMIMNAVDSVRCPSYKDLPTSHGYVNPKPGLELAVECWMNAKAPHHPIYTTLPMGQMEILARMSRLPFLTIDEETTPRSFYRDLEVETMRGGLRQLFLAMQAQGLV